MVAGKKTFAFTLLIFITIHVLGVHADEFFETKDAVAPIDYGNEGMYEPGTLEDDPWTMVDKKGQQFMLNDHPFYFNGFNTYWLMVFATDHSTQGKVSEVFKQAASVGLTVCRTWAFNDGQWKALQKSPSVYDEQVFKGLDFVLSEAKKYKIRLLLSLVNNWKDYGGKSQYVEWGKAAGLNLTSEDDFFSDPTVKTYYKNNVKTILNRVNTITNVTYKDDPTIFGWELMNEPRCTSDPSGMKLQAWIQEMAAYVKAIDSEHLLGIGLEGFYGPSTPSRVKTNPSTYATTVGTDFIKHHRILGIDFASAHIYPHWISNNVSSNDELKFYTSWMQAHVDDAEKVLKMPVVFSEFGKSKRDRGYKSSFRDAAYSRAYQMILRSAVHGGSAGGSLMWQLFPDGTDYMDDGYSVVLSKSPSLSSIIALQSTRMKLINSRCALHCRWNCLKRK